MSLKLDLLLQLLCLKIFQRGVTFFKRVNTTVRIDARASHNLLDFLLLVRLNLGKPIVYFHELVHYALVLVPRVFLKQEVTRLSSQVLSLNCVYLLINVLLKGLDSLIQSGLDKVEIALPSSIWIISVFHLLLNYKHVNIGVLLLGFVKDDSCVVTHNL